MDYFFFYQIEYGDLLPFFSSGNPHLPCNYFLTGKNSYPEITLYLFFIFMINSDKGSVIQVVDIINSDIGDIESCS